MATETISYSKNINGWDSFHSFIPDWMIGMNNSFYTWKNGDLYLHDSNVIRNSYYDTLYPSTITPVFNNNPLENKVFKTIGIDSNLPWKVEATTDFAEGVIEADYLKEKEGTWFGHIRRNSNTIDLKAMSTQGIGIGDFNILTNVFTFSFTISASISIGDVVYVTSDPSLTNLSLVGPIVGYNANSIEVGSVANPVSASGDMVVVMKDSTSESYGIRGSWMKVKLTNDYMAPSELFTISSDVVKSYP